MNRLEIILQDNFYKECLKKNAQKEVDRRFCKHDFAHLSLTSQLTYQLLKEQNLLKLIMEEIKEKDELILKEIVGAAGILHDIGRFVQYETGKDHALEGAKLAYSILKIAKFTPKEIEIIQKAIEEHNKNEKALTVLGKILCLADDLVRPCFECKAKEDCYKMPELLNKKQEMGVLVYEGDKNENFWRCLDWLPKK